MIIKNIDKWMEQNNAHYTGAFFPGVLLDNFILECKRGYAAVYEKPVTCWTSVYEMQFVPYKAAGTILYDRLFSEFYARQDAAEQAAREQEELYRRRFA